MKLHRSRSSRRGRIEIIPMIDVMFFLLASFMLASLSMQKLDSFAVNLPRGQAAPVQALDPVTLAVARDGRIFINRSLVTLDVLAENLLPLLKHPDAAVIVAADDEAPQGMVVKAMLQARQAGAERFLIAVKRDE